MEHEAQRILRFVILAMIVVAGAHSIVCRAADLEQYSRRLELKSLKTHSRLIFPVDDGVETKWQEREGGFEISFRGAALSDLGDISAIRDLNDNRLAELRFEEDTFGLLVRGKWKFPSGRTALANPVMEHFDYRETSTPSYVLDFWVKRGPTLIEARLAAQKASQLEAQKKSLAEAHVRSQRRLASDKAKEEAGNLGQLCGDQKSDNIYLPFLPVHKVVDLRRWFPISTPDWGFNYTESTSNKLARLALRLYRAGSLGLTIRVLDFIDEESPGTDSLIQDEMKLLRSSALFRLGHKDKSRQWLRQLMRGSGHVSAPVLQAGMFLAAEAFGNGVYLTALENFLWLVTQFPTHPNNWLFHLAAAECLYALKQTDRAAKEYQWVAQNGPDKEDRARGALRIGDIYMSRLEYERALGAYSQALSNFDIEAKNFASVHINRGEALYWLGQYDRAAEAFKRFAIEFPTDPAGWRATFRLAEIAEIKGTDNRGLIYETINRYPYSPGAILGRLKLLPCGDHGGFDVEGAERFFSTEALNFDGGGEVVVKHYADLRAISRLRTLMSMAENERAVDAAIEELKRAHSTSLAKPIITKVLRVVLRQSVLALL